MSTSSRLDYFAAHAPEMPEWFLRIATLPEYDGPLHPRDTDRGKWLEYLKLVRRPKPPEFIEIAQAERAHDQARQLHQMACAEAASFQWRVYYARKMVEMVAEAA